MSKVSITASKTDRVKRKKASGTGGNGKPIQPQGSGRMDTRVILKNLSVKPESQLTTFEKIEMVKEGISKRDLQHLKETIGLDYDQLAKTLSVARATLINKKGTEKFNHSLSEKIMGLADIFSYGYEVFENEESFREWVFRANIALGGQLPYDLLGSQYGREEIKNLLGRIEYGVYS